MRKTTAIACAVATLALIVTAGTRPAVAAMLSKVYEFRAGVILEMGASTEDGLLLESVRFQMPATTGVRTATEASVEVTITNTGDSSKRVGVGVALFDGAGRLVGVASGGTRLVGQKAGKKKSYKLVFSDLNVEAPRAETFQISVESRP